MKYGLDEKLKQQYTQIGHLIEPYTGKEYADFTITCRAKKVGEILTIDQLSIKKTPLTDK